MKIDMVQLLQTQDSLKVDKFLIQQLGIDAAVLYAQLQHEAATRFITKEGYFCVSSEELEENTDLSYYRQAKAINELMAAGLLETQIMGLPAAKYFKLNVAK